MSDDNGFVERPVITRGPAWDANSVLGRLRATAENGKAIVISVDQLGGSRSWLKRHGYKVHQTNKGLPAGQLIAWVEKIEGATNA